MSEWYKDINGDHWQFYEDKIGDWHWRHSDAFGIIIADSNGEFANKSECKENAIRNGMTSRGF